MGDFGSRHLGYPQSDPGILEQEKFNTPIQLVRMPGHPDNGGIGVFDVRTLYGIIESIMQHQKQKPPVNDRWLEVKNYYQADSTVYSIYSPPSNQKG